MSFRVYFLIVSALLTLRAGRLSADSPEPLVVVRLTLGAGYGDSADKLEDLKQTLELARTRRVTTAKGEDPSSIIARTFNFGRSDLPKSYQMVAASVRALNKDFTASVNAGSVLVPDIGRWALQKYNTHKSANFIPKIAYWDAAQVVFDAKAPGGVTFVGKPRIIDSGRAASQSVANEYAVPLSVALKWRSDPDFSGEILNTPLEASLAGESAADDFDIRLLDDASVAEMTSLLATAKGKSLLVVADTGWPRSEYDYSRVQLQEILNAFRHNFFPALKDVKFANKSFVAPTNNHCERVDRALREFRNLDSKDPHVKILYVPLTREQGGDDVAQEFWIANYLLQFMLKHPALADTGPTVDDEKHARELWEKVVAPQVPTTWGGQLTVRTDKSLIDSYLWVFNEYAELTNQSFFFNESWTSIRGALEVSYPSPFRGAVVAAAGNHDEMVIQDKVDFAQRCLEHRDTIAVMSMDGSGPLCHTGKIDESLVDDELAVGLDGHLGKSCDESGTSFSSPRVAWLFAAADCMRKKSFDMTHWGHDALNFLRHMRVSKPNFGTIRLDPLSFLRTAAQ